jgi:hypothetical protein
LGDKRTYRRFTPQQRLELVMASWRGERSIAELCREHDNRPQTNGKAERFIRTMLDGWAYGAIYRDSRERTDAPERHPQRLGDLRAGKAQPSQRDDDLDALVGRA